MLSFLWLSRFVDSNGDENSLFLYDLKTQEYCIRREYRFKKDVSECESYFYRNLFSRIGYLDCKIAKGVYFTLLNVIMPLMLPQ